jgi:hypothetical protein
VVSPPNKKFGVQNGEMGETIRDKVDKAEAKYKYRIYVTDADGDTFYFADSVKFEGTFVSFEPKAMLVPSDFQDQLHDQVLTFPSHLVRKITYYQTNPQSND